MTARIGARGLVEIVADPGSWKCWDTAPSYGDLEPEYLASIARAQARAGTDEAVITGRARIRGRDVVLIVSEFGFLGGSIGRETVRRIEAAVRRATAEGLPLVAAPASGGTRMQEGTPAFVGIVEITRAIVDHKAAGLPYLVYLRHPTTGGVLASWGSLGHLTAAEPGAMIGFLGPTVYEALCDRPFPDGIQRAEHLADRGIVDTLLAPDELAQFVDDALAAFDGEFDVTSIEASRSSTSDGRDPWAAIELTRLPARPGVRELLRFGADRVVPGSSMTPDTSRSALVATFASFGGIACAVVGQDRRSQAAGQPLGPDDLRRARSWMRMAERTSLPLVCVIDTPGADLSVAAEEGGVAREIARTIATLVELTVPSVSVILGEGCGGGALALLPSRRVVAAENAWLSPLPLEGASTILYGTTDRAADMAQSQRVGAADLLADGTVHAVVPEPIPAHEEPEAFVRRIVGTVTSHLVDQLTIRRNGDSGRPPAVHPAFETGKVYTLI